MTDLHYEVRARSFREDGALWVVLSHFLSASLLDELAGALVDSSSGGRLRFDSLFSSTVSGGPPYLASWALSERKVDGRFASYLQRVIQSLAWQNDQAPPLHDQDMAADEHGAARSLETAAVVAHVDFNTFAEGRRQWPEPLPRGIDALVAAMSTLIDAADVGDSGVVATVWDTLASIPPPLRLLTLKHLGDLCADADRPTLALAVYDEVARLTQMPGDHAWGELMTGFCVFLLQSRAAMLRLVEGPQAAAAILSPALQSQSFEQAALLHINGWLDGVNAESLASESLRMPEIPRAQVLAAPQLSQSHNLEDALEAWVRREFDDANRRLWAILRRQLAFGDASESRNTKAYFGRCILDELAASLGQHRRPDSFRLAVRLLIESGDAQVAAGAPWPQDLLDAYLQEAAVQDALAHAARHPGARLERHRVLVALCSDWLVNLSPEAGDLARTLLQHLAEVAKLGPQSFFSFRDLSRSSLKALETVAEARPEFRTLASAEVARAIVTGLYAHKAQVQWQALDTALKFADGFQPDDLRLCLEAVLARLADIEPSDNAWPFLRPAMGLLTSSATRALWTEDAELARGCAAMVLRFGLGAASENARLLFYLGEVQAYIDPTDDQRLALDVVMDDLRRRARQINSSAVTNAISGVLTIPRLAGVDGLADAIEGLASILKTAPQRRQSMGLPFAYNTLIQLAQQRATIMADLGLDDPQLEGLVEPIKAPLVGLWEAATANPLVFSAFSIPPRSAPEPTLIHNWAFATLRFAEAFGTPAGLDEALQRAAENPLLRDRIATGRAVRFGPEMLDPKEIAAEPKAAFYAALGKRLALLAAEAGADHAALLPVMLGQCLKLGPDGLDAGVMALVLKGNLATEVDPVVRKAYTARVERDRVLRMSLMPLLDALCLLDLV